jgi:prephenate dehydratase
MARTLAFLGPSGTYTEEAALLYDPAAELRPFPNITAVGKAVASGETPEGVVPIENSIEGSVNFTLDLLVSEGSLYIRNEMVLPIEHYLMGKPGTQMEDVQVVYSHPQALAQCREYLESKFGNAVSSASLSTAQAVGDAIASDIPAAAIAPRRSAELYNAEILDSAIQDVAANVTRFVVLAKSDHAPTGNDKTSMFFTFDEDVPGQLYTVMGEFAERGINLGKIESRPTKRSLGQYIFLVDCDGHRQDSLLGEVLQAVDERVSTLRVMGSYPKWTPDS